MALEALSEDGAKVGVGKKSVVVVVVVVDVEAKGSLACLNLGYGVTDRQIWRDDWVPEQAIGRRNMSGSTVREC